MHMHRRSGYESNGMFTTFLKYKLEEEGKHAARIGIAFE